MSLLLYNILFPIAFLLYSPFYLYRLVRRGGFAYHFGERFALYGAEQKAALAKLQAPVWVHAVSVGEVVAALTFIRRWQQRDPALHVVLSCTTATGHATARRKLPPNVALIYCPLDFLPCVWRALNLIRPRLLAIFEVEFWPNLITEATRRGVPVVLVNGRLSDHSAAGYYRHRWYFAGLMAKLSAMCMQSEEDALRIRRVVGEAAPVHVCSTMKFDQVADVQGRDRRVDLDAAFGPGERLVWTAGSTHSGEEALACDVLARLLPEFPHLRLVLVPRHAERTPEVEKLLRDHGLAYRLLKPAATAGPPPAAPAHVLVVNTTGDLMDFYQASDVAYVGKSLAGNEGGHNIIEPAIFGKPIVHGAHMENFRFVVDIFRQHEAAVEVATDDGLEPALRSLLADPDRRQDLGRRARAVVDRYRGAIDRTIDHITPVLGRDRPG